MFTPRCGRKYPRETYRIRGEELFEQTIRERVSDEDPLKHLLIDIDSGDFEVDADEQAAAGRLLSRRPDAQIWIRRVGSPYARRFGGGSWARID